MPQLSAHHASVTVSDLERAVDFYQDALDLDVADRFEVGGDAFATAVGAEGASGRFVHLVAGDGAADAADRVRIELVAFEPQGEPRGDGELVQPGTSHVAFETEDVDAAVAELPDDATLVSEPQTTESGARVVFLRDPEGNLVELLEP